MKKAKFLLVALFVAACIASAGQQARYTVMFYNVENLFDTIKSPGVLDEEFTPEGINKWDGNKYRKKLVRLEEVFFGVASAGKSFPTIIGVSEIENRNVLEDIAALPKLRQANYQIAHYDSPDARGVDVALFYRPDQFQYEGSAPIRVTMPDDPGFKTRDVLSVWGTIEGEPFCFFVNHWPSRRGGQQASAPKRDMAASVVRHAADSIMALRPGTKIVVMGDLNDDPIDESISKYLGAKAKISEAKNPTDFFNPYYEMFKKGYGTLAYQDAWNLFDNMIVNGALANAPDGTLRLVKAPNATYYGNIFDREFLRQKTGQYKGYPWRTYVGNAFQNGYSDHFPVYLYISK